MKVGLEEFFKLVMAEFGTIPISGVATITVVSVASAAAGVFLHSQQNLPIALQSTFAVLQLMAWAAAIYTLSMIATTWPLTLGGFIKYSVTATAAVVPLAAAFGLMLFASSSGNIILLPITLAVFFVLVFATSLLSGWPILQATSSKLIGPIAALRLTRGFRWPLIVAGMAVGAVNRLAPTASENDTLAAVLVLSGVASVASAFSAMVAVSISVAAWRLMLANQQVDK